jgi:hypothetical protein
MFGVTKDNQIGKSVDGNGRVSETVEEEGGLLFAGANKVRRTSKERMKTGIGRRTKVTSTDFEQ